MLHIEKMLIVSLDLHVKIRQVREEWKQGKANGELIREVQHLAREIKSLASGL